MTDTPAASRLEPGITWRTRMPRSVLDPIGPHGAPIIASTDRRMLWHLEATLAVTGGASDILRQAAADLRAYLNETCRHEWLTYDGDEVMPAHRQCLWCCDTRWAFTIPAPDDDGSTGGGLS